MKIFGRMGPVRSVLVLFVLSSLGFDLQTAWGARALCIFDYDLTLSSHNCRETRDKAAYNCRWNSSPTYGWYDQCLGVNARDALAQCVQRGAFIGINSHAPRDADWNDKVVPIVSEWQFPEFLSSPSYDNYHNGLRYPRIDAKENWNCDNCAYHMVPGSNKAEVVRKIMRHYGMNPYDGNDRSRVIFWDDSQSSIDAVNGMGQVNTVKIPRNYLENEVGGCGITWSHINDGWWKLGQ